MHRLSYMFGLVNIASGGSQRVHSIERTGLRMHIKEHLLATPRVALCRARSQYDVESASPPAGTLQVIPGFTTSPMCARWCSSISVRRHVSADALSTYLTQLR